MFTFCRDNLVVTVLGMLQVDSRGNVNVSKKSDRTRDYVGPGGFIDLVTAAKNIVFIGAFQARAKLAIEDGKMRVLETGIPKFVEAVDEITFYGPAAVERGQHVYYATPVGLFQLTARGLELVEVMPGIDPQKDILAQSPATILLPENGNVATAPQSYLTGRDYRLAWGG
jgi:propionate CoA-transferase